MARECKVCNSWEPHTIDRLLVLGYGPHSYRHGGI
jgi:hypothetical protein